MNKWTDDRMTVAMKKTAVRETWRLPSAVGMNRIHKTLTVANDGSWIWTTRTRRGQIESQPLESKPTTHPYTNYYTPLYLNSVCLLFSSRGGMDLQGRKFLPTHLVSGWLQGAEALRVRNKRFHVMPFGMVRIPSRSKNVDLNSISFSSERKQVKSRVLVKLGRGF
jgi:hypothetical protein